MEVAALKRINCRFNQVKTVAPAVLIALLSTPGFAEPAKTNYSARVSQMDAILKSNPNDEAAHYYRAVALQNAGDYQKAKLDYQWIISHSRNSTLVSYAAVAIKNLSLSTGTRTQATGTNQPGQPQPAQGLSTGKYSMLRAPIGQRR